MFDCTAFLRRMGWGQKDLAERLEIGTSTVGMWCIGKSTPTYPVIEKLLHLGMTPKELFGDEIDGMMRSYYMESGGIAVPAAFDSPEFREGVAKAIEDMKARGLIK